jgi:3-phosphoinositide dependent protein kinase-1
MEGMPRTPSSAEDAQRTAQRVWTRSSFEFGSVLGEGALAKVVHVRDSATKKEYALKIVEKRFVTQRRKVQEVLRERSLLTELVHPNIVVLHSAFQDDRCLYFVLELGEMSLAEAIIRYGWFQEGPAQFYAAELVNALTFLRERGIAHRDMKPDNVLVMQNRHLKLIDFDAAEYVDPARRKSGSDVVSSFVGTALYVAPEVLEGAEGEEVEGAGFSVDLWALGCITFQMLTGTTPFKAANEYWTFQRILNLDLSFPADFPPVARAFVSKLLERSPSLRIGYYNVLELQWDAYFTGLDFQNLPYTEPPELAPIRKGGSDMSSFWGTDDLECTPSTGHAFLRGTGADEHSPTRQYELTVDDRPSPGSSREELPGLVSSFSALTLSARRAQAECALQPGERILKFGDIVLRDARQGVRSPRLPPPRKCLMTLTDAPRLVLTTRAVGAPEEAAQSVTLDVVGVFPGDAPGSFLLQTSVQAYVCEHDEAGDHWVLSIRHTLLGPEGDGKTHHRCCLRPSRQNCTVM